MKLPAWIFAALLLAGCSSELPPIEGCESIGDIKPVCNMQTPEDIAALPDGRYLLLAHFGGMEEGHGSLSLFDTNTEAVTPLFPEGRAQRDEPGKAQLWGDSNCLAAPVEKFQPHGTHLGQLEDGRWRYLVVNHAREAIEIFELTPDGENSSLSWRGCVTAAEDTFMNDVVGLANGDLIFTRMLTSGGTIEFIGSLVGIDSGDLWRWNRDTGLRILPGTAAAQPNGIEISADNRFVFASMYMEKQVWKIDADSGGIVGTAAIPYADNSAWGSDGRLWVASHSGGLVEVGACIGKQSEPCASEFQIVALDPDTLDTEVVFTHRGPPMGAATVAVPQGGRVYMGSFVGERMISVPDFSRSQR
jgi:DNA-binding beta-propeller fold protein YncE